MLTNCLVKNWLALTFAALLSACVSAEQHSGNDSHQVANRGDMKFVGEISPEQLLADYKKFSRAYNAHVAEPRDIKNFSLLKGNDLVVFFGVWCHDSQREVPRLLKLIDQSAVELNSVKLVAINQDKELPVAYQARFEVKYTPTIFVVRQQQVIAKIVEKPKNTLTQDLLSQIFH